MNGMTTQQLKATVGDLLNWNGSHKKDFEYPFATTIGNDTHQFNICIPEHGKFLVRVIDRNTGAIGEWQDKSEDFKYLFE